MSFIPTEEIVEASVDIDPDTLNLKSNGEWVTAYVELQSGNDVGQITEVMLYVPTGTDSYTIVYKVETPSNVGDYDGDGVPDLMVKFDRSLVIDALGTVDVSEDVSGNVEEVALTVSGFVLESAFTGSDIIKVKYTGK